MADIPTIEELREELDLGARHTDAKIQRKLDAELAKQTKKCGVDVDGERVRRDPYPADLLDALIRRVSRSLAVADEPLGIITGAGDGNVGLGRVSGRDREIERLESDYVNYTGTVL